MAVVSLKQNLPLILGIAVGVVLLLYLVFPGFLIGFLIATGIVDPSVEKSTGVMMIDKVFCIPLILAEKLSAVSDFYSWQCYVVSGYR